MTDHPVNTVKLVALGDSGVGKTSLLLRFTTDTFPDGPDKYIPTVMDNYSSTCRIQNVDVKLCLFDTAQQPIALRFGQSLTPLVYPLTNVFLVCCDVTDSLTVENVEKYWFPDRNCLSNRLVPKGVSILIVGTKIDLRGEDDRSMSNDEGVELGAKLGCEYLECSAKTGEGVKKVFERALESGYNNLLEVERRREEKKNRKKCRLM